jgi:predicted metal-dependent hydrolase
VVVTVPPPNRRGWAHPEATIAAFLADREAWLRRHLGRQAEQRAMVASSSGLRDGASLRFRGEWHRLRLASAGSGATRSEVTREGGEAVDEVVVRVAPTDRRPIGAVLETWLRERARRAIDDQIAQHAPALDVVPATVTLRDPRSRWGSASPERRLSFSWRLVLAPPEALDTVVVHELAHLRVFGHGPAFWALVASRRPDHRVWRRWLRDHSVELHAALADAGT